MLELANEEFAIQKKILDDKYKQYEIDAEKVMITGAPITVGGPDALTMTFATKAIDNGDDPPVTFTITDGNDGKIVA